MELKCSVIPYLSLLSIIFCFYGKVIGAGNNETCPVEVKDDINDVCSYTNGHILNVDTGHIRDCSVDPYMSICALVHPNTTDWEFLCTSPNYNLGCRYGHENCVKYDKELDDQTFYLSWYDGITLGGKYSICDMGGASVIEQLSADPCYNNSIVKLQSCSLSFIQTFQSFDETQFTCDDMNEKISCMLDPLKNCGSKTAFKIFQKFYRGIVSLTECEGKIKAVGAGSLTYANVSLISLCMIVISVGNKIFG
ncbi:hypothetical protein CHUAL_013389 [Chamberlinius hualienensis]